MLERDKEVGRVRKTPVSSTCFKAEKLGRCLEARIAKISRRSLERKAQGEMKRSR